MNTARYCVTFGLRGCYMPDSNSGPMEFTRRKDLMDFIRGELEVYELPQSAIRQVRANRLWSFIKRHGSSQAHFAIHHGAHALEFHGLTEEEFLQQQTEE